MQKHVAIPPTPQTPLATTIETRPLIDEVQAAALMRLFKVFANDTRLRLLHALVRDEQLCVSELADVLDMKPPAISNQLQRLTDRGILGAQRKGNNVCYRVIDPCVQLLLERGLCLIECCPEPK